MKKLTIFLIVMVFAFAACEGVFSTPIKKIVENPREYDGKTVTISGNVTGVFSLFILKYFLVDDGTGEIVVITPRPLPKHGAKIKVTGKVSAAFSLGETQKVVILEEEKQKRGLNLKISNG